MEKGMPRHSSWKLFLSSALIASAIVTGPAGADPAPPEFALKVVGTPAVGSRFSIEVRGLRIEEANPIVAFGFNTEAPASWTLLETIIGPGFMSFDGFSGDPQIVGLLPFESMGEGVFGEDILLTTLTYRPNALGNAYLFRVLSDSANDLNEGVFLGESDVLDINQEITVSVAPSPVPEPMTMTLMGIGLAVAAPVVGNRKRKR